MIENEFDNDTKYRLFRTIREILHPTISKRNISDYKIILSDDILPIRVFYPKKISEIDNIILYIHGNGKVTSCHGEYSRICKELSNKLNKLVIGIEYEEDDKPYKDLLMDIEATVDYIYDGLEKNDKSSDKIVLMGDSTGCTMIEYLHTKKIGLKINKEILCYPILSLNIEDIRKFPSVDKNREFNPQLVRRLEEYYNQIEYKDNYKDLMKDNNINTLVLIGSVDSLSDYIKDYFSLKDPKTYKLLELPFANHGFLRKMDQELSEEFYKEINDFI